MAENTTKKFLTYEGLSYYDGKNKTYVTGKADAAQAAAIAASVVTVDVKATANTGYAKTYEVKQNNVSVGEIDIPKDLVISSGRVVTLADGEVEGISAGTYVELTLNDAGSDKIYINVATLVDVYTAQQNATQVQIAVDSATNVISATIVAGSIGTTELADGAVTEDKLGAKAVTAAKIGDGAVGTTQLASGVVTSLGKADTAVQSVTASDATTGTDGTITVDGDEVAVKGYSALAGRVQILENATIEEISNSDIDALFTSEPVETPSE